RVDKQTGLRAKGLDAYTCYPLQRQTPLNRTGIAVKDAFAPHDDTITTRTTVCAPAAAEGERLLDSKHMLSCSSVDSNVLGQTVLVRDDFGYLTASLGLRSQLCTALT